MTDVQVPGPTPNHRPTPVWMFLAGVAASAALLALYAAGGWAWPLGFVALVPWLLMLSRVRTAWGAILAGTAMAIAYAVAVFHWFAAAFGAYVGIDKAWALLVLVVLAPVFQPQFILYAWIRHYAARRARHRVAVLVAVAAWVASEWSLPKLLGDTLGHGLQPSDAMRQVADLGGAAGLTVLLLLVNEALARAIGVVRAHPRVALRALGLAVALVAIAGLYGAARLADVRAATAAPADSVRVGLVQANITDLERRRREAGAYAVIRELLDTHFAMSAHAVRDQGADVVLWSETIYPTTFGNPKSEDGAALDAEIVGFGRELGVPLVFGTYDRDEAGEYNAAAFLEPERGLLGLYRKTHPFPFTETVPTWLDGPRLRAWLPWTGAWLPGSGARAFPLRTADGREANVVPLICLDDVRPQLAIDGARLGAQAILGLSNDSWFTAYPAGARLHLAVASFRSVETRLPQLRATTNGLSAIVDETGAIVVHTEMGQQAVLVGDIPVRAPIPTLMLRWGDWVGRAGWGVLIGFFLLRLFRRFVPGEAIEAAIPVDPRAAFTVVAWSRPARVIAAALQGTAVVVLAGLGVRMALRDGFQVNSVDQLAWFGFGVVLPLAVAMVLRRWNSGTGQVVDHLLVLTQRRQRIEIPVHSIGALVPWRLPLPGRGFDLVLASGRSWSQGLVVADPIALMETLKTAGSPVLWPEGRAQTWAIRTAAQSVARHRFLDHPLLMSVLFPLLLALPAFRLHQVITFGGTFGEWQTFGPGAWLLGLLIWWGAWALGMGLFALLLRLAGAGVLAVLPNADASTWRARHRQAAYAFRVVYFLGVPAWLAFRLLAGG